MNDVTSPPDAGLDPSALRTLAGQPYGGLLLGLGFMQLDAHTASIALGDEESLEG